FAAPGPVEVARTHTVTAFAEGEAAATLLLGRPSTACGDPGATVCSCFGVGAKTIARAIEEQGLADVAAVGRALSAGTNCGSCKPEIEVILRAARPTLGQGMAAE
ncbi:MAG: (2Fe-2S)-binding protein, partial [Pseudomonadota bacterium]